MQQHNVIVPNKVGKHGHHNIQCVSSELYLFSSKICVSRNYSLNLNLKKKTKRVQLVQTPRGLRM